MTVPATFDTPHPITAKVELARGTLQVVASDRSDTVVAVLPRDEAKALDVRTAERTRVSYSKGVLSVLSSQGITFRTGTIDILIELPSQSILDIAVARQRCAQTATMPMSAFSPPAVSWSSTRSMARLRPIPLLEACRFVN